MIVNWQKEMTRIDPDIKFRAQGGWLKTVVKLDKTVKNGYSLVGDFVHAGDFDEEYDEGIYLDCNKEGTAKKPQQDYRLFRFRDGKVRLLDMVIDGKFFPFPSIIPLNLTGRSPVSPMSMLSSSLESTSLKNSSKSIASNTGAT